MHGDVDVLATSRYEDMSMADQAVTKSVVESDTYGERDVCIDQRRPAYRGTTARLGRKSWPPNRRVKAALSVEADDGAARRKVGDLGYRRDDVAGLDEREGEVLQHTRDKFRLSTCVWTNGLEVESHRSGSGASMQTSDR